MSEHHPVLQAFLKAGGSQPVGMPLGDSLQAMIHEMDPEAGTAVLSFEPSDQFLQGGGVIHGGIVSTMLDYALAMAGFSKLPAGKSFGTVSLTVHFLKPVLPGRHLARAAIDRIGASMVFASARLVKDGSDQPLATASAVMAISSVEGGGR